jgi:hypothetical protein
MAQVGFNPSQAATYFFKETSFCVSGTLVRGFPISKTFQHAITQKEIENEDERPNLYNNLKTIKGMKDGTLKFDYSVRPASSQYDSSTAPVNHPLGIILECLFGGKTTNTGALVGAAPTTGSVTVTNGALFSIGQWALFPTSGGLEPGRISNISSNTLTITPALSAAPISASAVVNMDNYYPTEQNSLSLTVAHAKAQNSAYQWSFLGCTGDIEFKSDRNDFCKITPNLKVGTWITGSQGLSTAVATDTNAVPLAVKDARCVFQATTDTAFNTAYPIASYGIKVNLANEHLMELGGIEGKTGVIRSGQRMFAEATIKFLADQAKSDTLWNAQTDMQLTLQIPVGTGTTKRWIVLDMPTCNIVGVPVFAEDNGKMYCTVTLHSAMNTITANSSTDLARAPFICALG